MYRYKVQKMGCGGCAKSVTKAVQGAAPGAIVEVDLQLGVETVSGVDISSDDVVGAIRGAGFPADALAA